MKKPKLEKIIDLLSKRQNFSLTREEYLSMTGADTPQNKSYTKTKSAVAKKAFEYGFQIEVIPEKLNFIINKK